MTDLAPRSDEALTTYRRDGMAPPPGLGKHLKHKVIPYLRRAFDAYLHSEDAQCQLRLLRVDGYALPSRSQFGTMLPVLEEEYESGGGMPGHMFAYGLTVGAARILRGRRDFMPDDEAWSAAKYEMLWHTSNWAIYLMVLAIVERYETVKRAFESPVGERERLILSERYEQEEARLTGFLRFWKCVGDDAEALAEVADLERELKTVRTNRRDVPQVV